MTTNVFVETSLSMAIKTENLRIVTHMKRKKEKKNEIISVATAMAIATVLQHSDRIKWLAQPLSHQQNRECDMVLSFVTLKSVHCTLYKMNENGNRVEDVDERKKNKRNMALILCHLVYLLYTLFHFLSRYTYKHVHDTHLLSK